MDFFDGLSSNISNLELLQEESQKSDKELYALEKKLGEYAANEEKQLLDRFSEMLSSSNSRKRILEKQSIDGLRENMARKNKQLDQETKNMKELTAFVEQKWTNHIQDMDIRYNEDSNVVTLSKDELEECLKHCQEDAEQLTEQWRDAEQCLVCLHKTNIELVDSVIKKGLEANETSRARASSITLSTIDEINIKKDSFLSSLEHIKQLDVEISDKQRSMIAPCCEEMRQMETNHSNGANKIIQNSEKCLVKEYKVDELSYVEKRKRSLVLPSLKTIEELKTPPLEELLKSFHDDKTTGKNR